MSMFSSPEEHAANPPSSWRVVKEMASRTWHLQTAFGTKLCAYERKRDAEQDKTTGQWVRMYEEEGRWFAGEDTEGWKPYVRRHAPIPVELYAAALAVGYRIETRKITSGDCWEVRIDPCPDDSGGAPYEHPVTGRRMIYNRRRDVLGRDIPKKVAQMLAERAVEGVTCEDAGRLTLQEALTKLQEVASRSREAANG